MVVDTVVPDKVTIDYAGNISYIYDDNDELMIGLYDDMVTMIR